MTRRWVGLPSPERSSHMSFKAPEVQDCQNMVSPCTAGIVEMQAIIKRDVPRERLVSCHQGRQAMPNQKNKPIQEDANQKRWMMMGQYRARSIKFFCHALCELFFMY